MKLEFDPSNQDETMMVLAMLRSAYVAEDKEPENVDKKMTGAPAVPPAPSVSTASHDVIDAAPFVQVTPQIIESQLTSEEHQEAIRIINGEQLPDPAIVFGAPTINVAATVADPASLPIVPPAPEVPVATVPLDKAGLPWDGRIHASTKTKIGDGTWKKLRGVDPELVAQVEAENRANPPAPTPVPVPVFEDDDDLTAPTTFAQLMPRLTAAITSGVLPNGATAKVCHALAIPGIVALQANESLIPQVWATLKRTWPALA